MRIWKIRYPLETLRLPSLALPDCAIYQRWDSVNKMLQSFLMFWCGYLFGRLLSCCGPLTTSRAPKGCFSSSSSSPSPSSSSSFLHLLPLTSLRENNTWGAQCTILLMSHSRLIFQDLVKICFLILSLVCGAYNRLNPTSFATDDHSGNRLSVWVTLWNHIISHFLCKKLFSFYLKYTVLFDSTSKMKSQK